MNLLLLAPFTLIVFYISLSLAVSVAERWSTILGASFCFIYLAAHVTYFLLTLRAPERQNFQRPLYIGIWAVNILFFIVMLTGIVSGLVMVRAAPLQAEALLPYGVGVFVIVANLFGTIVMRREDLRLENKNNCPECCYMLLSGREAGCLECGWNRSVNEGKEEREGKTRSI